mgnify:FL=1
MLFRSEPVDRRDRVEDLLQDDQAPRLPLLRHVLQLDSSAAIEPYARSQIVNERASDCRNASSVVRLRDVVGMASSGEATEDDVDDGPANVDLVVRLPPLEVEELYADGLGGEDGDEVVGGDAVLGDEALQDMKAFRGDLEDASVLEAERRGVGGVLDQASVHKVLADPFGYLARHGEGRRRRRRDDSLRVVGIRGTVRLAEAEGGEICGSVVGGEGIGVGAKEPCSVGEVERSKSVG